MSRTTVGAILGLHAQTSIHPGTGSALGTVDLPVQRERHTGWPIISGSALKGVLRDAARRKVGGAPGEADHSGVVVTIFGPPTQEADKAAGAASFTDARLATFPVRSIRGVFAWITCPAVLERLQRDASLAGVPVDWMIPRPVEGEAVVAPSSPLIAGNEARLMLEEFDFDAMAATDPTPIAIWIADHLMPAADHYDATRRRFASSFVVLPDDDFSHFVSNSTEVVARIGLNAETKTVRDGALFYQEFLPPETLFYALVIANPARNSSGNSAADILNLLAASIPSVLQIGGDETIGKGICSTRLFAAGGSEL